MSTPKKSTTRAAANLARMSEAMAEVKASATRTAAAMKAIADAEPKSRKGVGRVPAHARPQAKVTPKLVVRAEVGTYRKPDGAKVKGNRAARRAEGQRGKA